jgi:hypothetical protein
MPLLLTPVDHISKWKNIHGVEILNKNLNNQIKMVCQFVSELGFNEKKQLKNIIHPPHYPKP